MKTFGPMAVLGSPLICECSRAIAGKQKSPLVAAEGLPQATATSTLGIAESMHQGPLCLLLPLLTV